MEVPPWNSEVLSTINENNISHTVITETKEQIETITNLKTKVREELTKESFPNLVFLYSPEVLKIVPKLLLELLEEEYQKFKTFIQKPIKLVVFKDFHNFSQVWYLFDLIEHLNRINQSDISEKIIEDFQPNYVAYYNELWFSKAYYQRVLYVLHHTVINDEEKRVLELMVQSFELEWINLPEESQEKIKEINIKLAQLSNDFSNNIVKSKKEFSYLITNFEVIQELPEATLKIAKNKAKKEWKDWYLFGADPTSYSDILDYCSDGKIREDFAKARNSFASSWEFDNRPMVLEILKWEDEKAKLLWYKNFAELSLAKKMAKSPEVVFDIIGWITKKAKEKAIQDIQELKDYFHIDTIKYWDVPYYQRKLKQEKYAFDDKELKKYFEYDNVLNYLFEHVKNFYWVEMKKIEVASYDKEVSLFEVYRNGKIISYYILDSFYRDVKKSWAWADYPRRWHIRNWTKIIPVVVNVCNFQKSSEEWTLLTMNNVETLFHEFGHALHKMLSQNNYAHLSEFNVEKDFTELPSQIHENWVNDRESLEKLARHYETGEKLPQEMCDTLDNLKTFMSWLSVLTQNSYALLDMTIYSRNSPPNTIEELDQIILDLVNDTTIFPKWPEYKMYTWFSHIFSSSYKAWYYSYMRAELLEADVFARIKELWMFERNVWEKFINTILWQWTKKPASELFKDFMWRDLNNQAFMKRNWL